jgi:hypothetical protein
MWIRIRIRIWIRNTEFLIMKPLKRSPICWAPSQGQPGWPAWELASSPTVTVLVSDTDTGHVSAAKTRLVSGKRHWQLFSSGTEAAEWDVPEPGGGLLLGCLFSHRRHEFVEDEEERHKDKAQSTLLHT